MSDVDTVFFALSHPVRRGILARLCLGPATAGALTEVFGLAPSTMSGHFSTLRLAGLVTDRREGPRVWYSLDPAPLSEVQALLAEQFGVDPVRLSSEPIEGKP